MAKPVEEVLHFNAVRLRITGQGALEHYLTSMDNVASVKLANVNMLNTTDRELASLANVTKQRAQYMLRTVNLDDFFMISRIIIFVKPVAEGYPVKA